MQHAHERYILKCPVITFCILVMSLNKFMSLEFFVEYHRALRQWVADAFRLYGVFHPCTHTPTPHFKVSVSELVPTRSSMSFACFASELHDFLRDSVFDL